MSETSDVSKFYAYILRSNQDKGLYIGFTSDLKKRLIEHAKGKVRSIKIRVPFKLIHYEYFINKKDAKAREEFLKSGFGRKQLKSFLKNTLSLPWAESKGSQVYPNLTLFLASCTSLSGIRKFLRIESHKRARLLRKPNTRANICYVEDTPTWSNQ